MIKFDLLKLKDPQGFVLDEMRSMFERQAMRFEVDDVEDGKITVSMKARMTTIEVNNIIINEINQRWEGCTAEFVTDKVNNRHSLTVTYPTKKTNVKKKAA